MATIEKLISDEQLYWDFVHRESDEGTERWIVTPYQNDDFPGIVAVLIGERSKIRGDVDYVQRNIGGEWTLWPAHYGSY